MTCCWTAAGRRRGHGAGPLDVAIGDGRAACLLGWRNGGILNSSKQPASRWWRATQKTITSSRARVKFSSICKLPGRVSVAIGLSAAAGTARRDQHNKTGGALVARGQWPAGSSRGGASIWGKPLARHSGSHCRSRGQLKCAPSRRTWAQRDRAPVAASSAKSTLSRAKGKVNH